MKSGRTHLMDATPVMLGQEFGGYAATLALAGERLDSVLPRVRELPLGGTAVGTGINTPAEFAARAIGALEELTGQPFRETRDHFEAQGTRDSLVELSGVLRTIAVGLTKICNDLRWMASGPTTGLAEIQLPDLQPGSSIMPGKVNPVLPEATLMVCAQVIGNDVTVTTAGAAGSFELNVMLPVIARNVLESVRLLSTSTRTLAERCIDGITADAERMRAYAESSPSIVTPLNRIIGYEEAAKIAKQAMSDGTTIRDTVVAMGYVERGEITEEQLDVDGARRRSTTARWSTTWSAAVASWSSRPSRWRGLACPVARRWSRAPALALTTGTWSRRRCSDVSPDDAVDPPRITSRPAIPTIHVAVLASAEPVATVAAPDPVPPGASVGAVATHRTAEVVVAATTEQRVASGVAQHGHLELGRQAASVDVVVPQPGTHLEESGVTVAGDAAGGRDPRAHPLAGARPAAATSTTVYVCPGNAAGHWSA